MIIVLNGTSSSGKSTIAAELQQRLGDGWLYFAMDGYLGMLGSKFWGLHPNNKEVCTPNEICYAKKHSDGTYEIELGKLGQNLYDTIPDVLETIANKGFNIIVDSLLNKTSELNEYKIKLDRFGLISVYLYASEEVIATREEKRGDRLNGSAIHWLKAFECQSACDIAINTEEISPDEACSIILSKIPGK